MRAAMLVGCVLLATLGSTACESRAAADLSEAQLSRVVDEQRPSLERCYNAALEKTPYKHEVRMAAVIHVRPDGAVDSAEVEGTGLPGMPVCLRDAIRAWRFPTATDATHTRLPIVFSPEVVQTPPPGALLGAGAVDAP